MQQNNIMNKFLFGSSQKRIVSRKRIMTTYVSLFLICALLISATLSWFITSSSASISSDTLAMSASTGLSINEGDSITNKIIIDDFELCEASSVDGRNFYFPTLGSLASSQLSDIVFREGNAGDKNVLYASKSINIVGVTDPTYIYVKSYEIELKDSSGNTLELFDGTTHLEYDANNKPVKQIRHEDCPVRMAFIEDSQDTPRVFDPTAIIQQHVDNYDAVSFVASDGTNASTKRTDNQALSNYVFSYSNPPLYSINHSDSIDITMVAWLEGTGNNLDRYADGSISISIELESNYPNMIPIRFVDKTSNDDDGTKGTVAGWVDGKSSGKPCVVTMAYKDADGATKTVVMSYEQITEGEGDSAKTYNSWVAMMPANVKTDISFFRLSEKNETIFNAWHTNSHVNSELSTTAEEWLKLFKDKDGNQITALETTRGNSITYYARCGNGYSDVSEEDAEKDMKRLSPCIGFWDATVANSTFSGGSSGGGSGGGESGGGEDTAFTINIYLTPNSWMKSNLGKTTPDKVGIKVSYTDANDSVATKILEPTDKSDLSHIKFENQQLYAGEKITGVVMMDSTGKEYYTMSLSTPTVISREYNYTLTVGNDDKVSIS